MFAHIVLRVLLGLPLCPEFQEPGLLVWNAFLAAFLIAMVVSGFIGVRHLQKSGTVVGKARFTTRDG